MDILYENAYEMNLDRYRYFSNHLVGKKAKRWTKIWNILNAVFLVVVFLFTGFFFWMEEWALFILYLMATFFFAYRQFFRRKYLIKRQFKLISQSEKTDHWMTITTFSDVIKLRQTNSETTYQYADFVDITCDGDYFYLWRDADFVMRLPKDSFTTGDPAGFRAFMQGKIEEAAGSRKVIP